MCAVCLQGGSSHALLEHASSSWLGAGTPPESAAAALLLRRCQPLADVLPVDHLPDLIRVYVCFRVSRVGVGRQAHGAYFLNPCILGLHPQYTLSALQYTLATRPAAQPPVPLSSILACGCGSPGRMHAPTPASIFH